MTEILKKALKSILILLMILTFSAVTAAGVAEDGLSLARLESGLRETKSIGIFTKLSIKGDATDLAEDLLAYHDGKSEPTLAELRVQYDLLVNKILLLTQDEDPPLAEEIVSVREALWVVLADPNQLRAL